MTADELHEDNLKQKVCQEFFDEYDKEHRPRSLLEIHQVKVRV